MLVQSIPEPDSDHKKPVCNNTSDSSDKQEVEQPKKSWNDIFARVNCRPHEMTFYIAPFYYIKLVKNIEAETGWAMKNGHWVQLNDISIRICDSKCSFTVICGINQTPASRKKILDEYYTIIKDKLNIFLDSKDDESLSSSQLNNTFTWWHFQDDCGNPIQFSKAMNEATNKKLYEMISSKNQNVPFTNKISFFHGHQTYDIYLNQNWNGEGYQVNRQTNKQRYIKILDIQNTSSEKTKDFGSKELKFKPLKNLITVHPESWSDIDSLSFKTSIYNTVCIDLSSEEAKQIKQKMAKTMVSLQIFQIERVQNLVAYNKYYKEKELLQHKYDDEDILIEKMLFHGTRQTDPVLLIDTEEGFDMRFSSSGMWGPGIYFAEDASYSHKYSHSLAAPHN